MLVQGDCLDRPDTMSVELDFNTLQLSALYKGAGKFVCGISIDNTR